MIAGIAIVIIILLVVYNGLYVTLTEGAENAGLENAGPGIRRTWNLTNKLFPHVTDTSSIDCGQRFLVLHFQSCIFWSRIFRSCIDPIN